MKHPLHSILLPFALCFAPMIHGQAPTPAAPDHARLLASDDPRLASNKRLVYDFWREVMEGGHADLARNYLAESFVEHDPGLLSGRAKFAEALGQAVAPKPIQPEVKASLVTLTAEGDLVVIGFAAEGPDPHDAARSYATTWFDMYRVAGGRIVEHWDAAPIDAEAHLHRVTR